MKEKPADNNIGIVKEVSKELLKLEPNYTIGYHALRAYEEFRHAIENMEYQKHHGIEITMSVRQVPTCPEGHAFDEACDSCKRWSKCEITHQKKG